MQLNFTAKKVYLVLSGGKGTLETRLYGQFSDKRTVRLAPVKSQNIEVTGDDIYEIVNAPESSDYTIQITASP